MNPKISYTLVGLFVLLLGASAVTMIVWMSATATQKTYTTYVAYMYESVSGLNENAQVTYRGVDVGFVREIALDENRPDRVRLMLEIEEGTPVKEDTLAILVMQGITGLAKLELTGGSVESPRLVARPGARYPEIQTGASLFVRIDQAITTLTGSLDATIGQLNIVAERVGYLLDERNRDSIAETLDHIETVTGALANRSDTLQSGLRNAELVLRNAAEASERLPGLLDQTQASIGAFETTAQNIDQAVLAIQETASALTAAVGTVDEMVTSVRGEIEAFARTTPTQVVQLIAELQQLSENLQRFTHDLERDPNMLFFGRPQPPRGPGEGVSE